VDTLIHIAGAAAPRELRHAAACAMAVVTTHSPIGIINQLASTTPRK
jgi:hypothetical protein